MAVESTDGVVVNSKIGIDGNSYTTAISNDQLSDQDFLTLMLEEMKQQDPTKPMDSAKIMNDQLQMSTIQTNQEMSAALASLKASYANSALSTASNMLGHIVEDGSTNDDGVLRSYKVETVENQDGEIYLKVRELVGITDQIKDSETDDILRYDKSDGSIFDQDDEDTGYDVALDEDGRFIYNDDGTLRLLDEDGEVVDDDDVQDKYVFAGSTIDYAEDTNMIAMNNIETVR